MQSDSLQIALQSLQALIVFKGFDSLMVHYIPESIFWKVNFEKVQQMTKKHAKITQFSHAKYFF